MTRILIVRTSSLGDLVHMLPAMSDIASHVPDAKIDWLAEEAFADVPRWHPAIDDVIPVAHRRWRKSWWSEQTRAERHALRDRLANECYDIVLDMQALMKSAWLVRQAHGTRHGLDWCSAREPLASLFYDVRHRVEFWQPAVVRQRLLASLALGYRCEGEPNFGLQAHVLARQAAAAAAQEQPYVSIMPSASRDDKLWPADDWREVMRRLGRAGLGMKLLAGNAAETARANELIADIEGAEVMPRMRLTEVMTLLAGAKIMIGLDSGLTHLSAALGRPTIGIYRASTPVRTPLTGSSLNFSLGDRGAAPSLNAVLAATDQALAAT